MRCLPRMLATVSILPVLAATGTGCEQEIEMIEVRQGGLVANVWRPVGGGAHPGVLLVGGSGGGIGWQNGIGEILAHEGYVALALAYFGMDGLPLELERVPIEYVDHGMTYLRLQPDVDSTRLGIVGVSKGAELALLVASMRPELRATVAFVPSSVVWQSIADGYPDTSSWTYRGRGLPFVAYGTVEAPRSTADFYRAGLEQSDSIASATIEVERINGPILLFSGREDNLWPSTEFAERVVARLEENGFRHSVEHVAYADAGHLISSVRDEDVSRRGGTAAGNKRVQLDARDRMLEFLDRYLQPD